MKKNDMVYRIAGLLVVVALALVVYAVARADWSIGDICGVSEDNGVTYVSRMADSDGDGAADVCRSTTQRTTPLSTRLPEDQRQKHVRCVDTVCSGTEAYYVSSEDHDYDRRFWRDYYNNLEPERPPGHVLATIVPSTGSMAGTPVPVWLQPERTIRSEPTPVYYYGSSNETWSETRDVEDDLFRQEGRSWKTCDNGEVLLHNHGTSDSNIGWLSCESRAEYNSESSYYYQAYYASTGRTSIRDHGHTTSSDHGGVSHRHRPTPTPAPTHTPTPTPSPTPVGQ